MKKNIIPILMIILLANIVISAEPGTPLDSLEKFYQASIDEDLEAYIAIQDPYFLEQLETEAEANISDYFRAAFETVDMLEYYIEDEEIFIEDKTALIFYNLKGKYSTDESTESIDNDMVAFLWNYDDGWKVRWTITRTLYEQKLAFGLAADVAVETSLEEVNDETLKQELIDEGFVIDIDDTIEPEKELDIPYFWILLLIIIILLIIFQKKIFTKKKMHHISHKAEEHSKKALNKARPLAHKAHKKMKEGASKAKPVFVKLVHWIKEKIKKLELGRRFNNLSNNQKIVFFWIIIVLVCLIIWGWQLALGILIAGILSMILWHFTLNSAWEGTIEKIKTERVHKGGTDEESQNDYQDITYAYIKLTTGKTKKIRPHNHWKKGDKIRKEKGKMSPEKV